MVLRVCTHRTRRISWMESKVLGWGVEVGGKDVGRWSPKLYVSVHHAQGTPNWLKWAVHAWGYRRYVLSSMPVQRPLTEELKYTQSKIESNFSNFSAWHYRTKTLAAIWEENNASPEDIKKVKDKEFELVTQALWTDPGDQSGWLYHSWLIGQSTLTWLYQRHTNWRFHRATTWHSSTWIEEYPRALRHGARLKMCVITWQQLFDKLRWLGS